MTQFKVGDKVVQIEDAGYGFDAYNYPPDKFPVLTVISAHRGLTFSQTAPAGKREGAFHGRFALIEPRQSDTLGAKFDQGKLLFRPLMRGLALPLRAVAAVLSYGAQKYAEDSWQEVPDAKRRYEDAYYRHMNARESGEVYDTESGLPHRAHELCNLMFLLWFDIKDGTVKEFTKFNQPPERK